MKEYLIIFLPVKTSASERHLSLNKPDPAKSTSRVQFQMYSRKGSRCNSKDSSTIE
jgi:hypothetical protein